MKKYFFIPSLLMLLSAVMLMAGMRADLNEPGCRHIIFRPMPPEIQSHVKYYNEPPYGKAGIFWEKEYGQFTMNVTMPVGNYAMVFVPGDGRSNITESGKDFVNHLHIQ